MRNLWKGFDKKWPKSEFLLIWGPKVSQKLNLWGPYILHTSKSTCNEHVKQYWCETSKNFFRTWPKKARILTYFGVKNGPKIRPLRPILFTSPKVALREPIQFGKKVDGRTERQTERRADGRQTARYRVSFTPHKLCQNTIPMTFPRLLWTADNPSGMHRCQFQHPCMLILNCTLALSIYVFAGLILSILDRCHRSWAAVFQFWHKHTHTHTYKIYIFVYIPGIVSGYISLGILTKQTDPISDTDQVIHGGGQGLNQYWIYLEGKKINS